MSSTNPKPGVLWVSSAITQPSKLPREKFTTWYEDTHISEVIGTGGVPSATRYEAVQPPSTSKSLKATMEAPWLTVYEMPDVEFRHTKTFKGLDGQTKPKGNLLEEIFSNTVFKTKFCELLDRQEAEETKKGPARWAVSVTEEVQGRSEQEKKVGERYVEVVKRVRRMKGWVRSRMFRVVDSTILDEFRRRDGLGCGERVAYCVLHEFEGEEFPWEGVSGLMEGERDTEIGYFRRKRVYGELRSRSGVAG
jgi:hypothetical protein